MSGGSPEPTAKQRNFRDLSLAALRDAVKDIEEPSYRTGQLLKWTYCKRAAAFDTMRNIPKRLRGRLASSFTLAKLPVSRVIQSEAGDAVKFGFPAPGGCIESVLLYDGRRRTACLSSQLGCALGCVFCETGRMGFIRNLDLAEITGQMVALNDYLERRSDKMVTNVVFMGMGEALFNFERFTETVELLTHGDAFNLARRRITVSTAGVVPSINRLAEQGPHVGLAISLNTYCDSLRNEIMPVNRRYPIQSVTAAAGEYARKTGLTVTYEYVVVAGENDTPRAARALRSLLDPSLCKINLIPLNPTSSATGNRPSDRAMESFGRRLRDMGMTVTHRRSRGSDIAGACGQLGTAGPTRPKR